MTFSRASRANICCQWAVSSDEAPNLPILSVHTSEMRKRLLNPGHSMTAKKTWKPLRREIIQHRLQKQHPHHLPSQAWNAGQVGIKTWLPTQLQVIIWYQYWSVVLVCQNRCPRQLSLAQCQWDMTKDSSWFQRLQKHAPNLLLQIGATQLL